MKPDVARRQKLGVLLIGRAGDVQSRAIAGQNAAIDEVLRRLACQQLSTQRFQ